MNWYNKNHYHDRNRGITKVNSNSISMGSVQWAINTYWLGLYHSAFSHVRRWGINVIGIAHPVTQHSVCNYDVTSAITWETEPIQCTWDLGLELSVIEHTLLVGLYWARHQSVRLIKAWYGFPPDIQSSDGHCPRNIISKPLLTNRFGLKAIVSVPWCCPGGIS